MDDGPVTLQAIATLLDNRLAPMNDSMTNLEEKFAELQINVENEMHGIRRTTEDTFEEIRERIEILESNVENMHSQLGNEIQKSSDQQASMSNQIEACESAILDIKEQLADFDIDGASLSENAKKIRVLEMELQELKSVKREPRTNTFQEMYEEDKMQSKNEYFEENNGRW